MRLLCFLLVVIATTSIDATNYEVKKPTEWWQTTTLYQIWPRSFKDSDGDGVGDLNGITEKLEHFVDMGIETIWISPFFASPLIDSGYDVSDYREVNPAYGTLEDFENLVARVKELGLKILLDFVPNHSSDEHEWFIQSKAGVEPYTDYYIWNEGILDANGTRQPPNNWLSVFNSGSAWEWVEDRQAYYLHHFDKTQVEFNMTNPLVLQEMRDIMYYWLDFGVDGFRVDAVPVFIEDSLLRDEPESGLPGVLPNEFLYLNHIYILDQPGDYEIITIFRSYMDDYNNAIDDGENRVIFSEVYTDISKIMGYTAAGSHITFNFYFIKSNLTELAITDTASDIVNIINTWMGTMPANESANWVFGNHDNPRVATRFGDGRIDALNMLLFLLPGVAVIYNGDEIGMTDTFLTWEETEDPRACSTDETLYTVYSRDTVRTPYQWDNSTSAGFSTNSTTMLPVNTNYLTVNLAAQKAADASHYKKVQTLIELRNSSVIREGTLDVDVVNDRVIAIARGLESEGSIVALINWDNVTSTTVSLEIFENLPDTLQVLIADMNSGISVGDVYNKTSIELPANAAVVLEGIPSWDFRRLKTSRNPLLSKPKIPDQSMHQRREFAMKKN